MYKQRTQQVPKEEQNFKCFSCGEKVYFKSGFYATNGKAQRFNFSNNQVHVCSSNAQKDKSDRRRKAYWANKRAEEKRQSSQSASQQAWNNYHERQEKKKQKEKERYTAPTNMNRIKAMFILKLKDGYTKIELETAKRLGWLKYHPDRNHGIGAEELFREVTDAFDYLSNFE